MDENQAKTIDDKEFEEKWGNLLQWVSTKTSDEISSMDEIDPYQRQLLLTLKYSIQKRALDEELALCEKMRHE